MKLRIIKKSNQYSERFYVERKDVLGWELCPGPIYGYKTIDEATEAKEYFESKKTDVIE